MTRREWEEEEERLMRVRARGNAFFEFNERKIRFEIYGLGMDIRVLL